jgi:hypothetical protein
MQRMIFPQCVAQKQRCLLCLGFFGVSVGASHQASEVVYLNRDSFFIYWPMMRTTLLSGRVLF